jgi:hypothetical protein
MMLAGLGPTADEARSDLAAAREVTDLPFITLGLPWEIFADQGLLRNLGVKLRYVNQFPAFRIALQGIYHVYAHIGQGGNPDDFADRLAPMELCRESPRAITDEGRYRAWSDRYVRGAGG